MASAAMLEERLLIVVKTAEAKNKTHVLRQEVTDIMTHAFNWQEMTGKVRGQCGHLVGSAF